eukprot:GHRR01019027.1.p1 GENE.GHRR01019027.1~~GHRR01019027.1.p1  ORF type:complete len:164 (+),score=49.94 GHRR01019027.1:417-908(+)
MFPQAFPLACDKHTGHIKHLHAATIALNARGSGYPALGLNLSYSNLLRCAETQYWLYAGTPNDKVQLVLCRVRVLCPKLKDLNGIKSEQQALQLIKQQGNSELGFLQFFNLHRMEPAIQQLVWSKQLAAAAAQLLSVQRLRLYQVMHWHSQQHMPVFPLTFRA